MPLAARETVRVGSGLPTYLCQEVGLGLYRLPRELRDLILYDLVFPAEYPVLLRDLKQHYFTSGQHDPERVFALAIHKHRALFRGNTVPQNFYGFSIKELVRAGKINFKHITQSIDVADESGSVEVELTGMGITGIVNLNDLPFASTNYEVEFDIDLSNNAITDFTADSLDLNIKRLNLAHNKIRSIAALEQIGGDAVGYNVQLESIDLTGNPLTQEQIQELRNELRTAGHEGCEVIFNVDEDTDQESDEEQESSSENVGSDEDEDAS